MYLMAPELCTQWEETTDPASSISPCAPCENSLEPPGSYYGTPWECPSDEDVSQICPVLVLCLVKIIESSFSPLVGKVWIYKPQTRKEGKNDLSPNVHPTLSPGSFPEAASLIRNHVFWPLWGSFHRDSFWQGPHGKNQVCSLELGNTAAVRKLPLLSPGHFRLYRLSQNWASERLYFFLIRQFTFRKEKWLLALKLYEVWDWISACRQTFEVSAQRPRRQPLGPCLKTWSGQKLSFKVTSSI